jgi:hypothetical protein
VDEIVPVAVAPLGDIHAEGGEQVLGVARRQAALGEGGAQRQGLGGGLAAAEQGLLQAIEPRELVGFGKRGVVGDVVGRPGEAIERQDGAAVARMDEVRGDREILATVGLGRCDGSLFRHCRHDALAWTRPFHRPPLPRAC